MFEFFFQLTNTFMYVFTSGCRTCFRNCTEHTHVAHHCITASDVTVAAPIIPDSYVLTTPVLRVCVCVCVREREREVFLQLPKYSRSGNPFLPNFVLFSSNKGETGYALSNWRV
jgi:hypothetical protein